MVEVRARPRARSRGRQDKGAQPQSKAVLQAVITGLEEWRCQRDEEDCNHAGPAGGPVLSRARSALATSLGDRTTGYPTAGRPGSGT